MDVEYQIELLTKQLEDLKKHIKATSTEPEMSSLELLATSKSSEMRIEELHPPPGEYSALFSPCFYPLDGYAGGLDKDNDTIQALIDHVNKVCGTDADSDHEDLDQFLQVVNSAIAEEPTVRKYAVPKVEYSSLLIEPETIDLARQNSLFNEELSLATIEYLKRHKLTTDFSGSIKTRVLDMDKIAKLTKLQ